MAKEFFYTLIPIRVVRKIDHEPEILKLENIHTARRLRSRRDKSLQRGLNILGLKAPYKRSQRSRHHILYHEGHGPAEGKGYQYGALHTYFPVAFLDSHKTILTNTGYPALAAVRF